MTLPPHYVPQGPLADPGPVDVRRVIVTALVTLTLCAAVLGGCLAFLAHALGTGGFRSPNS